MKKADKTVLIVEDDSILNDAYTMILKTAGYNVKNVWDGQEALDYLKSSNPDVILLDLRMPVLDGIGVLEQYQRPEGDKPKIVVFSNFDNKDEIEKAYSLGADHYVLKARATPKELLKLVGSLA